jgi:CubicO group peptidase (beta-lactamase class C family)
MGLSPALEKLAELDALIEPMLRAARIPGGALAIVADGKLVFAKGYGYRDLAAKLPLTADTVYPIASTTKAFNATLIGMLVDEGKLAWDAPVQTYLPRFRLGDGAMSSQITLRDLLAMRTGLPRHDWLWQEQPMTRAELVERLRDLELSAGFREKFQYNNMTSTTAGHIAEVITGKSWEELIRERIFAPLGMSRSTFALPESGPYTLSYHENASRQVVLSARLESTVTAPSGGSVHSTVEDMARWMLFNLNGGQVEGRALIQPATLTEIHAPQMVARTDPSCPTPNASYALNWFVDTYNNHARLAHGGYVHDVNSEVTLFPALKLGFVSFTNFGFPTLARTINEHAFDLLMGQKPVTSLQEKLGLYEKKLEENEKRLGAVRRVEGTAPSHSLDAYAGVYAHPGYGKIEVQRSGDELVYKRNALVFPLQHWHYDAWVPRDIGVFFRHVPHAFDKSSRFMFETSADGDIVAINIRFEPNVAPIRFQKQ